MLDAAAVWTKIIFCFKYFCANPLALTFVIVTRCHVAVVDLGFSLLQKSLWSRFIVLLQTKTRRYAGL